MVRDGQPAEAGEAVDEARFERRPPRAQVGAVEGLDLHASVVIGATDHEGRERLLRHLARPTVASGRVSELADGRFACRLTVPAGAERRTGSLEPVEFMTRPALVPPPGYPRVRQFPHFVQTLEQFEASLDVRASLDRQIGEGRPVVLLRVSGVGADLGPLLNDPDVTVQVYQVAFPTFSNCANVGMDRQVYAVDDRSLTPGDLDSARLRFGGSIVEGRLRVIPDPAGAAAPAFLLPMPFVRGTSLTLNLREPRLRLTLGNSGATAGNLGGYAQQGEVLTTTAATPALREFHVAIAPLFPGFVDVATGSPTRSCEAPQGGVGVGLGFSAVRAVIAPATVSGAPAGTCGTGSDAGAPTDEGAPTDAGASDAGALRDVPVGASEPDLCPAPRGTITVPGLPFSADGTTAGASGASEIAPRPLRLRSRPAQPRLAVMTAVPNDATRPGRPAMSGRSRYRLEDDRVCIDIRMKTSQHLFDNRAPRPSASATSTPAPSSTSPPQRRTSPASDGASWVSPIA